MKLSYPLAPEEQAALDRLDPAGTVLYAVPYDIEDGRIVSGMFVITERVFARLLDGEAVASFRHGDCTDLTIERRFGIAALLAKRDGVTVEICLFSLGRYEARFISLLEPLERLSHHHLPDGEENRDPEVVCPRCGLPYPPGTTLCRFCTRGKRNWRCLLDATRGLRLLLLVPLLVMLASLAVRFIVPSLQKTAINGYIYPPDGVERGPTEKFFAIVISLVLLSLLTRVLGVISTRLSGIAGVRFGVRLRRVLFEKVESLSLSTVQRRSIGYLAERINGDVVVIRDFLINRIPTLVSQVAGLIIGVVLIFSISPRMSLLVLLPLPVAVLLIFGTRRWLLRLSLRHQAASRRYSRSQYDILGGERVVKAFGREADVAERNERLTEKDNRAELRHSLLSTAVSLLFMLIVEVGSYLITWFGNLWLFRGRMDVGTINQFSAYSAIFYEPLRGFSSLPGELARFVAALGQVMEILDEEPEIVDPAEPRALDDMKGHIKVKRVSFGYRTGEEVLKGVSLEVAPGEMVGIVGHSGCGKTTLVNLILRLYDVDRGAIEIDGIDVRELSQATLRSKIGVVPQETQLFDGTVRENIRYACKSATDEQVILAARAASAHDFILSLPEGYNTRVGEKGYSLSGGERQRIAIARALLHDPRILILDEATAALDTATEKAIQGAIDNLTSGRTTIAIAHRLSTLRNANRIIVIDHGRVVEHGTHKELIDKRGRYYKLVMSQVTLAQA